MAEAPGAGATGTGCARAGPVRGRRAAAIALSALLVAPCAVAAAAATPAPRQPVELPTIVVTATRSPEPAFDLPASITAVPLDRVGADRERTTPAAALRRVPGVLARDRQNFAEGEQISIRGFGARSSFGVRGIRLYVDGIPATMPDGQGDVSNFSLASADRIEVLRGPFSALYGNSSGGVIQLFTADGSDPPEQRLGLAAGSFGSVHLDVDVRGRHGASGYNADLEGLRTAGYRVHGRARRARGNAKWGLALPHGGKLTLLLNSVWLQAQDPQGLDWAQVQANPRQAPASALAYDTRKRVRQDQAGMVFEQPVGGGQSIRLLAYVGHRDTLQFLSVPVAAQASPLSSGGVIDLATRYGGADARWQWRGAWLGRPLRATLGASFDREAQHRRGLENFAGGRLGVIGALRRDEQDDVAAFDQYAQARWDIAPRWSLSAGVRHSRVAFRTEDAYVTAGNPDDSGAVRYSATTPVAGLVWHARPDWNLYAAYGRGFETPTFSELAYRADGGAGLAFDLRPARSDNYELGSKWRWDGGAGELDLALFQSDTRDAIAVAGSAGGRTTFRNAGATRRRGWELSLDAPLGDAWQVHLAYTRIDGRFTHVDACPAGCGLVAGARIPGVARERFFGELRWGGDSGWHALVDVSALGAIVADDANSAHAPGYASVDLDVGYVARSARSIVAPFLRIDNVFDRAYIGALIVNDRNGRYFQPAPGRTVMAGVRIRFLDAPAPVNAR